MKQMTLLEAKQTLREHGYKLLTEKDYNKEREALIEKVNKEMVPIIMNIVFKRSFGQDEFYNSLMEGYEKLKNIMDNKDWSKEEKAEMILDSFI